jgi:hypothetical protein
MIDDAARAEFVWYMTDQDQPAVAPVAFVHHACARTFDASHPGRWLHHPLELLPTILTTSLHIDPAHLGKTTQVHQEIGDLVGK